MDKQTPPPQRTSNKTKVLIRKTDEDRGTNEKSDSKTKPLYTPHGKKKGFTKAAIIIGAVAVAIAMALLYTFWPKDKETETDKPLARQENHIEKVVQTPAQETSEEVDEEEYLDEIDDDEKVDIPPMEVSTEVGEKPIKEETVIKEEKPKAIEAEDKKDVAKTSDAKKDPPKVESQMARTTAIDILLSGQGDMTAARNALSKQEAIDVQTISVLYNTLNISQRDKANQILNQLRTGRLSTANAKSQMQMLAGSAPSPSTTTTTSANGTARSNAIRILLGDTSLGKEKDAKKVLNEQEIETIKKIKKIYNGLTDHRKVKASSEIINPLIKGTMAPQIALQRITNLSNGR
ncbi:MAG: hypothetical protein IKH88_12700 [Prevotella sp.]|nr:hypothetical protein [Prevotella sp.]